MLLKFKPDLRSEYILSRVSEEQICEYYTNSKVSLKGKFIKSPIRSALGLPEDKTPSFSYTYRKGVLIWKDWGIGNSGNCFELIKVLYNISYKEALEKIYKDLIEGRYIISKPLTKVSYIEDNEVLISYTIQPFTGFDILYWQKFNIDISLLTFYNVYSIKILSVKEHQFNSYWRNPMYVYTYNKDNFKIYKPFDNKKYKFMRIGKGELLEGYDQLDWVGNLLIITKSQKDVMCLRSFGYNAISLQSETSRLSEDTYRLLKKRFKNIVSLYDKDMSGVQGSNRLLISYNIPQLFIDDKYNVKDISDFCAEYGAEKTREYLNFLLN